MCRAEILVDILRNCEYSRRPPDDVIIRQGELGDTYAHNALARSLNTRVQRCVVPVRAASTSS